MKRPALLIALLALVLAATVSAVCAAADSPTLFGPLLCPLLELPPIQPPYNGGSDHQCCADCSTTENNCEDQCWRRRAFEDYNNCNDGCLGHWITCADTCPGSNACHQRD